MARGCAPELGTVKASQSPTRSISLRMRPRLQLFLSSTPLLLRPHKPPHRHARLSRCGSTHRKSRSPHSSAALETADSLLTRLEATPLLRILDIRGRVTKPARRTETGFQPFEYHADDEAYNTCHIPTATFLDWRTINIATPDTLCDTLSSHGITRETPVVVYDWGNMFFATRAWFALLAVGVRDVAVLNGGWEAWEAASGPVDDHSPCPLTIHADMEANTPEGEIPSATVSLKEIRALVESDESVVLVDARSEKQFKGIERRFKSAGRIPGSVNLPYRRLLKENGVGLRSTDELRQILGDAGLLDRDVVAYCSGGVSSTLVLFSLARCGVPLRRLRNYCGSFGEWGNLNDTPIETG